KLFTRKSFMIMSGLDEVVKDRKNVQIDYPLLILVGDNDIPLAQKIAKSFHKSVPKSEFYLIPNAGHCANMDNEKEFNKRLMNFIVGVKANSHQQNFN
ncbi:MAG: alpha/beta hydrolase, partial [Melioribacteraceae bacterium]